MFATASLMSKWKVPLFIILTHPTTGGVTASFATLGGIGIIDGRAVTIIGNVKGSNLKENIDVNYGMSHPEGYRKALRLAKQAERFNRPIITFIDTLGAFPGLGSEKHGIGEAIATNLKELSTLEVPILNFIIR